MKLRLVFTARTPLASAHFHLHVIRLFEVTPYRGVAYSWQMRNNHIRL